MDFKNEDGTPMSVEEALEKWDPQRQLDTAREMLAKLEAWESGEDVAFETNIDSLAEDAIEAENEMAATEADAVDNMAASMPPVPAMPMPPAPPSDLDFSEDIAEDSADETNEYEEEPEIVSEEEELLEDVPFFVDDEMPQEEAVDDIADDEDILEDVIEAEDEVAVDPDTIVEEEYDEDEISLDDVTEIGTIEGLDFDIEVEDTFDEEPSFGDENLSEDILDDEIVSDSIAEDDVVAEDDMEFSDGDQELEDLTEVIDFGDALPDQDYAGYDTIVSDDEFSDGDSAIDEILAVEPAEDKFVFAEEIDEDEVKSFTGALHLDFDDIDLSLDEDESPEPSFDPNMTRPIIDLPSIFPTDGDMPVPSAPPAPPAEFNDPFQDTDIIIDDDNDEEIVFVGGELDGDPVFDNETINDVVEDEPEENKAPAWQFWKHL